MSDNDISKLEDEYKSLLNEKIEKMKKEKLEAEKAEERKKIEAEVRSKIMEELNKKTDAGLTDVDKLEKTPKNDLVKFRGDFLKAHGYKPVEYGGSQWLTGYEFSNSDSGCDNDVDDWTPSEVFANIIWSAFYCKGYLSGKVTVRGIDFERGKGDTVSIRIIGKRSTVQGPLGSCECLSCASNSFTVESVTLDAYGDMTEICELDLQKAGDVAKDAILENMASNVAEAVDVEIYNQLYNASAGYTDTLSNCCEVTDDGCCMDAFGRELVNSIIEMEASMREGGYRPDYIIISPSVAAHFKYKEASSMIGLPISYSGNELAKIGNMQVIEFPSAKTCTWLSTNGGIAAILLDSRRAVGEGWGMKPKFEQDRNIDCDSTTVAVHFYIGIDELDASAIGQISVPSCG